MAIRSDPRFEPSALHRPPGPTGLRSRLPQPVQGNALTALCKAMVTARRKGAFRSLLTVRAAP